MLGEPLQPSQFVIELWAGRRIAVGQIQATDQHAVHRGLDVAAVHVFRIAGQRAPDLRRLLISSKDGDTVVALLAVPDHSISRLPYRTFRKFLLWRLEFLQTYDVGSRLLQPAKQIGKPGIDAVDVVCGDAHARYCSELLVRTAPKD
jgi:hypothetical protein